MGNGLSYTYSGFLELYNNGDTTVFLDGVVFGAIPPASRNLRLGSGPVTVDYCRIWQTVRSDPSALPLLATQVFPGTGRAYPVAPGAAVVVAIDAIDHRPFAAGTLDLSSADFESLGDSRDVDNPAVPNLTSIPGTTFVGAAGRGFPFGSVLPDAYVLAKPRQQPLERRTIDPNWSFASNVPFLDAGDVLDMAWLTLTPEINAQLEASGIEIFDCPDPWHPNWERAPAPIIDQNRWRGDRSALVRRTAYTRPDGRVVLQRTKTSPRDWVYGPLPTPGAVQ